MTPDSPYDKSRLELLAYEDSELYRLLTFVPDYYVSRTDQTLSGQMLRAVAAELGRLEFFHAYGLMAKDPTYLSPVDARRRYADPLGIPREYPKSYQTDLEFQEMIVNLLAAFRQGATVQSLTDVIKAYVGSAIIIEEAFKKIGQTGYDQSDRNTLRVLTQAGGTASASGVKTLTENLYSALDLAKPAHVGLSLNAMFVESDAFTTELALLDELTIIVMFLEGAPLPDALHLYSESGTKLPTTPETHIGPTAKGYTRANITLVGLGTQVGGSWTQPLVEGDVVKVSAQTDIRQNGYYVAKAGVWERFVAYEGVVSPILERVWEVQDEDPIILDME
jgi:hypothetical protein